jgi:hypothetical protein
LSNLGLGRTIGIGGIALAFVATFGSFIWFTLCTIAFPLRPLAFTAVRPLAFGTLTLLFAARLLAAARSFAAVTTFAAIVAPAATSATTTAAFTALATRRALFALALIASFSAIYLFALFTGNSTLFSAVLVVSWFFLISLRAARWPTFLTLAITRSLLSTAAATGPFPAFCPLPTPRPLSTFWPFPSFRPFAALGPISLFAACRPIRLLAAFGPFRALASVWSLCTFRPCSTL